MALIDVLPQFRYRALDLTPVESKLVPRPGTELKQPDTPIEKINVTTPMTTPVTQTTKPTTLAPSPRLTLPDVFKAFTPLADAISDSTVTNPKARAALIAQAGFEKGWKPVDDFNYGNIIAGPTWKGATVDRGDLDGKGNPIIQKFRKYGSAKEYVDDYLALLQRQYPAAYSELHSDNFDVDRFADGLLGGKYRYAEAPDYKEQLKKVYNSVDSRVNKSK